MHQKTSDYYTKSYQIITGGQLDLQLPDEIDLMWYFVKPMLLEQDSY